MSRGLTLGMKYILGRLIDMAHVLTHTCLPASPALQAAGFTVVVALEHDRIPLAAFKLGKDASAWCNAQNGLTPPKSIDVTQTLTPNHAAGVVVAPAPIHPAPAPTHPGPVPVPVPVPGPVPPKPH